jgi:hypothetical protein
MNPTPEDTRVSGGGAPAEIPTQTAAEIDSTLRLMATVRVPAGLDERIHAALEAAPKQGRVLSWPAAAWPSSMRAAAAAAIVVVVTGGGWGIYTRVQHLARTAAPVAPQMVQPAGGFSSAGAIRTPQTVQGLAVNPDEKKLDEKKVNEKNLDGKKPGRKIPRHGVKPVPVQPPVQ